MSSENHVGARRPASFGSYRIATVTANIAATGNAVASLAILSGGISATGGAYTVRRVTAVNLSNGNVAPGIVAIISSNDGNIANAITSNITLASLSSNNTYQDMTLASGANTNMQTASALFLDVQTANTNGTSITFNVYGDIVVP